MWGPGYDVKLSNEVLFVLQSVFQMNFSARVVFEGYACLNNPLAEPTCVLRRFYLTNIDIHLFRVGPAAHSVTVYSRA